MYELPPGASVLLAAPGHGESGLRLPIWLYWAQIAKKAADDAERLTPPDAHIDAMSARLAQQQVPIPDAPDRGSAQLHAGMIALSASAHSIDAFYGTIKPLVQPPAFRRGTRRERQILETLKLGFRIGKDAVLWAPDMEWLFSARDRLVHHAEEYRPLVVARVTSETVVISGMEAFAISAPSAQRAANLATAIIRTCLDRPRASTANWVASCRELAASLARPQGSGGG
jgi:hypothetical protein